MWKTAAEATDRRRDAINHMYIHVPFCKSICNFCNYERLRPSKASLMDTYVERVLRSLYAFGEVVEPMRWHTMYFGGGTPSTLTSGQLKKILVALDETLKWHPRSTRFFEFDPAAMSPKRMEVLVEHGFEHFSFGIQTLTAETNAAHNRGHQGMDIVQRRFKELRAFGVFNISADMLLGLKGTTPEQMAEEIGQVLELKPRWLDLFYLTPTREYVESHWNSEWDPFWKHLHEFYERIPKLVRPMAAKHGFRMRRGHGHNIILYRQMGPHERRNDGKGGIFSYTQLVDQQRRPLHLMGLGTSARSLIFGQAQLECRDPDEVNDTENRHNYFGNDIGMEGEIRLFLCHILRDQDVVDRPMFKRIFGMDITEAIPTACAVWDMQGKLTLTRDELRLTREERLDRIRTLMWVVPDERLEYEVERHEKNRLAQAKMKNQQGKSSGNAKKNDGKRLNL